MKKLFVSFTSLLRLVSSGEVTEEDLRQGLFFFGCWREHALYPGAAGEVDERAWHEGRYAHAHPRIVQALLLAESERRAAWHNAPVLVEGPWELLNRLLSDNGFTPVQPLSAVGCHYCYPAVRDVVAQQVIGLEVIY